MKKHVLVIGGGIAGTAAAHALTARGHDVTILEKSDYIGGRIRSVDADNTTFEMGAGFITNAYTNILAFIKDNDLDDSLYRLDGQSGIFRGNKVKMATANNLLGNDTLSWGAKMHLIPLLAKILLHWRRLDVHHPLKAQNFDARTVDELFSGDGGKELLEYVLQPILNGYFYWSPEETSEAILLMIGKALMQGGSYRLRGGLSQIPETAATRATTLLNHEVTQVAALPGNKFEIIYRHKGKSVRMQTDGIVCATTASTALQILAHATDQQRLFLSSVRYSSTALVAQMYKQSQIKGDSGIAFPRQEGYSLAAVTVCPDPGFGAKPMGTVKAFASGIHAKEILATDDQALTKRLTKELSVVQDVVLHDGAKPSSTHIQRWPEALPVFDRGYFHRLRAFMKEEAVHDGLVFAGDYIGGPLMEGAFTSGVQAAERLDAYLGARY